VLELQYPAQPDERGVVDGMQLESPCVNDAARLLVPYAAGCHDTIFTGLAYEALEAVHQKLKEDKTYGVSHALGPLGEERDAAIETHLSASREAVIALFQGGKAHSH
jgi:hypothetical protein